MDKHTSKSYDHELTAAKELLLTMGNLAVSNVGKAIKALSDGDKELARAVIESDKTINDHERQLDDKVVKLVAMRQPTAVGLRYIMSMSKAVIDLERIGDEAVKIARIALYDTPIHANVHTLADNVRMMMLDALEAFNNHDSRFAFDVMQMDELVDSEYGELLAGLQDKDEIKSSEIMHTLWVLRALERVGDHARNVAELAIYTSSGTDIRHSEMSVVRDVVGE
ncbi:Phosphate transport system protein phoU [Moraxella lacunata]|uniref:Phosphate-specific transport system accessory protein PhoU n=1 Tax=Moraxella lacunata TaxID=477 RepID=A0A378TS27_MORLA|nr:phosphate signaling complex protein PhoU [Moraxella lacunata]STZ62750.1 Phosphate transport system protein phoU [Moraxella lacunata]